MRATGAQEFHCVLASTPKVARVQGSCLGAKMATVDQERRVVATTDDGLVWECYVGEKAVKRGIADRSVLGQMRSAPSHG